MLMVHHVVLHILNNLSEIVNFKHKHSVVLHDGRNRFGHAVDVGDMRVHIVGTDEVGFAVLFNYLLRHWNVEKMVDQNQTVVVDRLYDIRRGIDAYNGLNPLVRKGFEQDTIITAELHDD